MSDVETQASPVVPAGSPGENRSTSNRTDAAAVAAARVNMLEEAWNRADGTAFGQVFSPDADFVNVRGEHIRGTVAIGHGHQAIFESIYAGSTVRYAVESAREVAPGCVVAVVGATLDVPQGPLEGVNEARYTAVLVESGGAWPVVAFQNTMIERRH